MAKDSGIERTHHTFNPYCLAGSRHRSDRVVLLISATALARRWTETMMGLPANPSTAGTSPPKIYSVPCSSFSAFWKNAS